MDPNVIEEIRKVHRSWKECPFRQSPLGAVTIFIDGFIRKRALEGLGIAVRAEPTIVRDRDALVLRAIVGTGKCTKKRTMTRCILLHAWLSRNADGFCVVGFCMQRQKMPRKRSRKSQSVQLPSRGLTTAKDRHFAASEHRRSAVPSWPRAPNRFPKPVELGVGPALNLLTWHPKT